MIERSFHPLKRGNIVKLFGSYTSPFARHVRIALQESLLPFEFIETSFDDSAEQSPTKKVPFLKDGNITLSDSTSILRYIREKAGNLFLTDIMQLELYCLINTLADSAINLVILEKNGLDTQTNAYCTRQAARIQDGLDNLNHRQLSKENMDIDSYWRLMCFLDYGLFRHAFNLESRPHLRALLDNAHNNVLFKSTEPPR